MSDGRVLLAGAVRTVDPVQRARADQVARRERQAELDVLLAAAREQGRSAGVADTLAAGADAVLRASAALERLEAQVAARQQAEDRAVSAEVLELGLQVAEWVLRRELADDSGRALLTRLEAGLTALLPSPVTRIAVSPADADVVRDWADGRGRAGTTVVPDARLQPGDAVVTTDAGRADVTVAAALHAAAESLGLPAPGGPA